MQTGKPQRTIVEWKITLRIYKGPLRREMVKVTYMSLADKKLLGQECLTVIYTVPSMVPWC